MSVPVVAVIGAGYAGLACAVELARAGVHVTVFERSHTLGGRARVVHKDHHWRVDNGQHILIGAYTELTRLLRLTGGSPKLLAHLPLTLHVPGRLHLKAAALPAPFHLAVGLLRAKGLTWADRMAMVRLMRRLKKSDFRVPPEMTVTGLMRETRQTAAMIELVWVPLCVAALNTPPGDASAQIFANVLRDSLAGSASASELLIPRVDLSELFPVPAARYLATRRGKLRTGNAIDAIRPVAGGFRLEGDPGSQPWPHVVVATAPYHAGTLLASTGQCDRLAAQIDALPHEPIVSVYLALGKGQRLPEPMIGLVSGATAGPAQWAFDRGQLGGPEGLIACVISASGPHETLPRDELILQTHAQLERHLGRRLPSPEWSQVIVEKRATIACRPGIFRPGIRTPMRGLWLAGDYLESDYPATLESAVRSGIACAQAILAELGYAS
ncbi:Phytoene desaturase, pro-zeta-carotene producing [Thauera humireducens]|uniref:hydroxysqualene dehydroxylase HpnE n=1 Tax=Thauera TaxID=33057 RepID=UPI0002CFC89B|nr:MULTISPECIES: hydroxysqualene dehydroxylase HpnE [Thauera]ENO80139.1 squalene-associated FAD-dependent desaturase [Thauera sp. 63]CAH1748871.1 Phytoene desaturase, pro-zeta-carotene producing [Thauera humireducens]